MSALRTPLPRPPREKAEPTNIRLSRSLKQDAAHAAVNRYGWPLTKLIRVLLKKELSHKRGTLTDWDRQHIKSE